MNIDKFYSYLNDFSLLNEKSLEELKQLINSYPFFNILYIIYAKNVQKFSDYELNDIIPLASMYVISRSHFYKIIKKEILDYPKTEDAKYSSTTTKEELIAEKELYSKREAISDYYTQKSEQDEEENTFSEGKSNLPVVPINDEVASYYASITFYQNSTLTFKFSQKSYAVNTNEIFYEPDKKPQDNEIDILLKKVENFKITPTNNDVEPVIYDYNENEEFYTETMAEILASQEFYEKAINIYEKLILKFPEKINYFADKIKELKLKINKL